jgi:HNH endonuclease
MQHSVRAANGCLECDLSPTRAGYPRLQGTTVSRIVWTETVGPIPAGMVIMHDCDNPRCVDVTHLIFGTYSDNTQDMIAKGRARFTPPRGRPGA